HFLDGEGRLFAAVYSLDVEQREDPAALSSFGLHTAGGLRLVENLPPQLSRLAVLHIVGRSPFGIAQDAVRVDDLFEGLLVARVAVVRVIALRQHPVNPPDRFLIGVGADLKDFVIVDEGLHRKPPPGGRETVMRQVEAVSNKAKPLFSVPKFTCPGTEVL